MGVSLGIRIVLHVYLFLFLFFLRGHPWPELGRVLLERRRRVLCGVLCGLDNGVYLHTLVAVLGLKPGVLAFMEASCRCHSLISRLVYFFRELSC